MDDKSFDALKLRMQIVPAADRWPDDLHHWATLKSAALEARSRVAKVDEAVAAIDEDPTLSAQGKAERRRQVAEKALAEAEASQALDGARQSVDRMMQRWNAKLGEGIEPPEDPRGVAVAVQIRDHVAAMKDGRLAFVERNLHDATLVSAILTAPAFLSGLSDTEVGVIRGKIEERVSPEIVKARSDTAKALAETEQGWTRAIRLIAERGGIEPVRKVA